MRLFIFVPAAAMCFTLISCQTMIPSSQDSAKDDLELDSQSLIAPQLWSQEHRTSTASTQYLIGEYLFLGGQVEEASARFNSAYNLDPNAFLGRKLIHARAQLGAKDVLAESHKMVLLYPKDSELRLLYSQLLLGHNFSDAAIKELEEALRLDPSFESAYVSLIEVHLTKRELRKALAIAKDFTKNRPDSGPAWNRLAKIYLMLGEKKKAEAPAQKAFDAQSSNPESILLYALALEYNGKSEAAIKLYEKIHRLDPTNEQLMGRLVNLYRQIGGLEEALEVLGELSSSASEESRQGLQLQRAILLWELGKYEQASGILEGLVESHPTSDRLRYMSGLGKEKLNMVDEALALFRGISKGSQLWYHGQVRVGVIYRGKKEYRKALEVITPLLQDENSSWETYALAGGLTSDSGDEISAIEVLSEGYKKFPKAHRLLFLVGVYQEKVGQIEKCIQTMRLVIERDSSNSSAYNYLGYLFAEQNQNLDEAEKLIEKALELKPGDGFYMDSLGWVYYRQEKYQKSLEILYKALEAQPNEGVILEHIAEVHLKLGDQDRAQKYFEQALAGRLESRDRKRIEQKITQYAK